MLKPKKKTLGKFKKVITKEVTKSYNSYINNMGESLTTNPKQFWSFIRQNKTKNLGIPVLKVNNDLKTADHDKANALNDLFKSIFFTNEQFPIPTKGPSLSPSIQTLEIGLSGIIKQLVALNSNKAPGPSDITAKILKETAKEISPIIQHIFRQMSK